MKVCDQYVGACTHFQVFVNSDLVTTSNFTSLASTPIPVIVVAQKETSENRSILFEKFPTFDSKKIGKMIMKEKIYNMPIEKKLKASIDKSILMWNYTPLN